MEKNIFILLVVLIILMIVFDVSFIVIFFVFILGSIFFAQKDGDKKAAKIKTANDFLDKKLVEDNFTIIKRIDTSDAKNRNVFLVDSNSKRIAIFNYDIESVTYIAFNSIINVELIEDNSTIMQGGIGRAIAGGVLAGGVGAIVGASTRSSDDVVRSLQVRIITNNLDNPCNLISIISSPDAKIKRDSGIYKEMFALTQEIYSIVYSIIEQNKKAEVCTKNNVDAFSISDRMKELVHLKNQQLITEVEYEAKRSELLARL